MFVLPSSMTRLFVKYLAIYKWNFSLIWSRFWASNVYLMLSVFLMFLILLDKETTYLHASIRKINRLYINKMIKFHGSIPDTSPEISSSDQETMLDLLKDWTLFWQLMNQCFTWIVIVLGYYGLSLTSVSLSGDPYLNFFLVSLVELPGQDLVEPFAWP